MADSVTGEPTAQGETATNMAEDAHTARVQPFRLMDLPLELRTMIFKELLVMPGPILFKTSLSFNSPSGETYRFVRDPEPFVNVGSEAVRGQHVFKESEIAPQKDSLRIFSVSKAIYRETVPIYFGCNMFDFDDLGTFERFITKLEAEFRWQLARVTITYTGIAPARAVKHLVGCVGLRELTLHIQRWSMVSTTLASPDQIQLYGMKDLLRVRGLKELNLVMPDHIHPFGARYLVNIGYAQDAAKIDLGDLKERLQVLKLPMDPKKLTRQERKDFPVRIMRTIFGAANVLTRGESKALAEKQSTTVT